MLAHVHMLHNPFMPARGRETFVVDHPVTIRDWVTAAGITEFERPTICLFNGEAILRDQWQTVTIDRSDLVTFITLPQGGGGGDGKILRSVLAIAVMVAAPYAGAALAGAIGVTSTVGIAFVTAGVAFAGSTLLNVLVPPASPCHSFE